MFCTRDGHLYLKRGAGFAPFHLRIYINSVITAEKGQVSVLLLQETADDLGILTGKAVGADIVRGLPGCCHCWLMLARHKQASIRTSRSVRREGTCTAWRDPGCCPGPRRCLQAKSLLIEPRTRWFPVLHECWLWRLRQGGVLRDQEINFTGCARLQESWVFRRYSLETERCVNVKTYDGESLVLMYKLIKVISG